MQNNENISIVIDKLEQLILRVDKIQERFGNIENNIAKIDKGVSDIKGSFASTEQTLEGMISDSLSSFSGLTESYEGSLFEDFGYDKEKLNELKKTLMSARDKISKNT